MHPAALSFVADMVQAHCLRGDVLELGGRNVNGGVRTLIPHEVWISVDLADGRDVDIVADAADLDLPDRFDVVVCTEVLEHTPRAHEIVAVAQRHLRPGGQFIATMAGPTREPHGCMGGAVGDEFYRNVDPADLTLWLQLAGFTAYTVDQFESDVRCWAVA